MTLTNNDANLFYETWLPLLEYVNQTYKVSSKLSRITQTTNPNVEELMKVVGKLWEDVSVIDTYINVKGNLLTIEQIELLKGWKRFKSGRFVLERHLKSGSIFISVQDTSTYLVSGIVSPWVDMLYQAPLPLLLEVTLIPFKDKIISDGFATPLHLSFGSNMKDVFKQNYLSAKKEKRVIERL